MIVRNGPLGGSGGGKGGKMKRSARYGGKELVGTGVEEETEGEERGMVGRV